MVQGVTDRPQKALQKSYHIPAPRNDGKMNCMMHFIAILRPGESKAPRAAPASATAGQGEAKMSEASLAVYGQKEAFVSLECT